MDFYTGFYRFPAMEDVDKFSPEDQAEHVLSEAKEVKDATMIESYYEPMLELMDVIHSAETMLRIYGCTEKELELLRDLTIEKNTKRGYYGKEA